ncbi:50S ribosomal protein L31 [Patescibacteria group bacterium]
MKTKVHPTYHPDATVTCSCGNSFTTGSTVKDIHVEICAACHPLYTGKSKLVDTTGQVDKFKARVERKSKEPIKSRAKKRAEVKAKKIAKKVEK